MDFFQFIGFIIILIFAFFLAYKRIKEERLRRKNPEKFEEERREQQAKLKNFLKSLEVDMEEEEIPRPKPSPPPKPKPPAPKPKPHRTVGNEFSYKADLDKYKSKVDLEGFKYKTTLEDRYKRQPKPTDAPAYEVAYKEGPPRIRTLLERLSSKKEMVLFQIIMEPPKGLRKKNEQLF